MSGQVGDALKGMVTRGKVTDTRVGPRTLLQIAGLDGVTQQVVELLLPPGYSARPVNGADLLLMQVLGQADHVVALGGDNAGTTINDLAPGEFGLTNGTQKVVFRGDHLQVTSPSYVLMDTPELRCTGAVTAYYGTGSHVGLTTHTHTQGADSHGDTEVATNAPTAGT